MGYRLWVMGYDICAMGCGLWVMGDGLWVMGYELWASVLDAWLYQNQSMFLLVCLVQQKTPLPVNFWEPHTMPPLPARKNWKRQSEPLKN
jgi:hypothetical protein